MNLSMCAFAALAAKAILQIHYDSVKCFLPTFLYTLNPTHASYGSVLAYRCELIGSPLCVIAIGPDGYRSPWFYP